MERREPHGHHAHAGRFRVRDQVLHAAVLAACIDEDFWLGALEREDRLLLVADDEDWPKELYRRLGRTAEADAMLARIVDKAAAAFLFTPLGDWLTIAKLKESRESLMQLVQARPVLSAATFFLFCLVATGVGFGYVLRSGE